MKSTNHTEIKCATADTPDAAALQKIESTKPIMIFREPICKVQMKFENCN